MVSTVVMNNMPLGLSLKSTKKRTPEILSIDATVTKGKGLKKCKNFVLVMFSGLYFW